VRTAMDTRTRGVQVLPKRKQSQSNNQVLSKSKKESQSQSLLLINKSPPRKTTTTTPLSMSSSSSSSISRAVEPFPFPLSMSLTGSSSFSPPRWGPPDMVLTLFPTPPRPNVKVNDKVRTNTSTELSLMKSSPEIFKTTTGTTATSSDNDNDNDCDDHDHYNNSYSFNEPFYFDIDDHDQQDAILNEEDHGHGHSHGHGYSRSLPIPPPPEQEQPMARDYTYSWEEFSRDSSSTISTWNQEDLEDQDRNPSESRRVALVLEHDDDDDDDDEIRVVASTSASGRCWESPLAARRMATAAGKVKETLMTTGNYSNHDAGLSRSNVGFRQGILPLEIEKTIATSAWPPHQSFAVTPAAEESKNLELALFPTREPHAHATFTFEPQWERAVTVVPSIERPTEGNKDDTNTVMGPWINFRLPENPFAPDSEFSSCYDDDIPRSPFAPIEQPSLPPKKAFVVASPQADRAEQKKTKTLTKSPRKMERAARTVTAAAGPVINYSSAGRVSVQHAPFATNVVAGRVHHDESVAFVGGRIVAKPRQNNDGPSRASREAVAAGSKAATKPVRSFVVNAKARRRNLGPGIAAVQSLRKKEAKAVAEAAKSFVANSKSDCQNFGQGAVTELVESNPVKELVANPNSDRQRVDQGAVTELVKANLVKSFVANPNSDRQNVGQGGAVTEQVKSNPVKSFISNSNYALQHLNHGAVTEPVKSNPIKSFVANSNSRQPLNHGAVTELVKSNPVKPFVANSNSRRQHFNHGAVTELVKSDPAKPFVANSNSRQPLNHGAVTELVKSNPVKPIVANSKSRRQRFNHGAVTELVKSDPVKPFVADSNYAGQNVGQGAVTEPVKSFVVNAKAGRNLGQGTVAEHSRREKESSDSTTQSRPMQRRAPLLLGHLLEERYQAARRKDLLPRGPVAVDGEKNAESDDAVRSIQETPALAKYAKMLKVGLPISAIKNAMERDGADLGVFDNGKCKPSGLSDDPAFAKYARMLKVGLPVSAVKNAMERDGVDPCVLDGGASGPTKAGKNELVASEAAKDPYRRFRLHWETHSNVRSNTIWAMVSRDQDWLAEFQVDEEEVETLFRASKKSTVVAEVTTTNRAGSDGAVRVIDPQRANNGGIILARIKFSYRDIARAVDSYDIAALTLEQIRAILPYIPTAEERHDLQGFISKYGQPPKTECEKFMVEILAVDEAKRKLGKRCL
jgi:hypothetical protein